MYSLYGAIQAHKSEGTAGRKKPRVKISKRFVLGLEFEFSTHLLLHQYRLVIF